jgi:RNA polymerase sigma-70 factor (ECF subfamily)
MQSSSAAETLKTEAFHRHRPRLFGLAYRMLGSRADADDVLQDAYLRWHGADSSLVRSDEAWLVTTVTRLAIDCLRKAKIEREAYFGPWLPEPLGDSDVRTPEQAAELDSDVSVAVLALLESLAPEERAAFVLHDVLDEDYVDIAAVLGKNEAACRQMVHRARQRVTARRRRFDVDEAARVRILGRFISAADRGDRDALIALFAADAVMTSDGGGKAVALIRPIHGAERIAWLWFAVARRASLRVTRRIVRVNGEPAIALSINERLHSVATVDTDGRLIHAYYTIANPDKLGAFAAH